MVNRNRDKLTTAGKIINWLGVLAWGQVDEFNEEPFMRRLHPLTLLLLVVALVVGVVTRGPVEGAKELWEDIEVHTVWWFAPKPKEDWLPLSDLKKEQQQRRKEDFNVK